MKEPLISRNYRIKKEQDDSLKKIAKKLKQGEGELVREGIDWIISARSAK
jgi:hypothetical protein